MKTIAILAAGIMAAGCSMTTVPSGALGVAKTAAELTGYQGKIDAAAGALGYSSAPRAPLVRDVYVDNAGVTLTNGVRRVRTYQSVEDVAPAAGLAVVPPALPVPVAGDAAAIEAIGKRLP